MPALPGICPPFRAHRSRPCPRRGGRGRLLAWGLARLRALLTAALGGALVPVLALAQPAPGLGERAPILSDAEHLDWSAIGRVNIGGFRSHGLCTGTLVAPDLVLSAAHCVFDRTANAPYPPNRVRFVAGWYKGGYVAQRRAAALFFDTPDNAAPPLSPGRAADIVLIRLETPIPVDVIAPLALTPAGADLNAAGPLRLLAYGRSRPHALSDRADCRVLDQTRAVLALSCPVEGGNSGAPVLSPIPPAAPGDTAPGPSTSARWSVSAVTSASARGPGPIRALAIRPGARLRARVLAGQ